MKNIIIKKNGVSQSFADIGYINTDSVDGGGDEWVPEDEYKTGVKLITSNGLYNPQDDGVAGYTAVVVNVPPLEQITGIDPADGKKYTITKDEFGNILKIPVE